MAAKEFLYLQDHFGCQTSVFLCLFCKIISRKILSSSPLFKIVLKFHLKALEYLRLIKQYPVEICALLGYYAALNGSSGPTFWDNLSVSTSRVKKSKTWAEFLTLEDGNDRLSRNVGTELPLNGA
jgi:hypothetical protein